MTFDQNLRKCKVGIQILLMLLTEKNDHFNELMGLIVHFDKRGRVILDFHLNSLKFVQKEGQNKRKRKAVNRNCVILIEIEDETIF